MSRSETEQIVQNGLVRLQMTIDGDALDEIARLSQGLPYITHLLALNSSKTTIADQRRQILLAAIRNHAAHSISHRHLEYF